MTTTKKNKNKIPYQIVNAVGPGLPRKNTTTTNKKILDRILNVLCPQGILRNYMNWNLIQTYEEKKGKNKTTTIKNKQATAATAMRSQYWKQ